MSNVTLRFRDLPSGKRQAYLDIYRGQGSRRTESIGIVPEDSVARKNFMLQAREFRDKRAAELRSEILGVSLPYNPDDDFIGYALAIIGEYKEPTTRNLLTSAINALKGFAGRNRITFKEIAAKRFHEDYKRHLLNTVSDSSARTYFRGLRNFLNRAVKDGRLPFNPTVGVSIKVEGKLPVFLSLEEVRRLEQARCGNETVKNAFLFSCYTGLRHSDIKRLTWDMIVDGYVEFRQKKTGKQERQPLSAGAKAVLERQKGVPPDTRWGRDIPADIIFPLPVGNTINYDLRYWAKAAKITKPITFHKARHTFATLCLTAGMDLYTVSKLLGHKTIASTQIYAQVVDSKRVEAIGLLDRLTDIAS
jgi:integrase